ncbi:uncharacterized protein TRUGW13939_07000 [Talaromyces rugulosus]|uniref:SnoaL-like domain-containing protein n=1 Tax=Talaromyces rugulosus TaxID=121627 RepID=A0A7H8R1J4_TALRU|nr:uncharacterized protein TRUGW13939_07000 [Talaromyces rugulosus]QKX59858.1 hypothetical protein TRUGW13939_07000 [Talaromyces rugulosus]
MSISLSSLTPREAISDTLYRCLLGLDTNDLPMFKSAWLAEDPDVSIAVGDTVTLGFDNITEAVFKRIGALDTTHFTTNIRIDLKDGSDKASLTSYTLAQHYRPGEGHNPEGQQLLTGGLYYVDLEKDKGDGLWKVKKWTIKFIWSEGDMSIVGR